MKLARIVAREPAQARCGRNRKLLSRNYLSAGNDASENAADCADRELQFAGTEVLVRSSMLKYDRRTFLCQHPACAGRISTI
jgi:hypothetical protein